MGTPLAGVSVAGKHPQIPITLHAIPPPGRKTAAASGRNEAPHTSQPPQRAGGDKQRKGTGEGRKEGRKQPVGDVGDEAKSWITMTLVLRQHNGPWPISLSVCVGCERMWVVADLISPSVTVQCLDFSEETRREGAAGSRPVTKLKLLFPVAHSPIKFHSSEALKWTFSNACVAFVPTLKWEIKKKKALSLHGYFIIAGQKSGSGRTGLDNGTNYRSAFKA